MVAVGPMPGSTPIIVPRRQPMKQYIRLMGVKATPKPIERLLMRSMVRFRSGGQERRPHWELEVQQQDEGAIAQHRQHDREDGHFLELEFVAAQARSEE